MRIGIDIRAVGHQRTGDETYTLQLIKSLARIDKENIYFLYTTANNNKDISNIKKLLAIENKNFELKSVKSVNRFLWTAWSLPQQAKRDGVDILHVQYITPLFFTHNLKIITTIHDISFARYPQFIDKKDLWLLKIFIPLSLRRADKIIAVSKFTRNEMIDVYNIKEQKIEIIHNGGVAKEFEREIKDKDLLEFRRRYGIIKPYVLFLGTLQPRKNIPFLIKSFVALKVKNKKNKEIKDLTLVLRGKRNGHNYDTSIDSVLKSVKDKYPTIYKQIKFVGYLTNEEIPFIFKGAELFSFTSLYEGYGLPLLESMSVGTPVLANNNSCFPEIINNAGMIYKTNKYDDWVKKAEELLKNNKLRKELIDRGFLQAKKFTWENNATKTIELYNNLIKY